MIEASGVDDLLTLPLEPWAIKIPRLVTLVPLKHGIVLEYVFVLLIGIADGSLL